MGRRRRSRRGASLGTPSSRLDEAPPSVDQEANWVVSGGDPELAERLLTSPDDDAPAPRAAFPQVEEADATGTLAGAYADMRATLRVPWVMFAARALAPFGGFVPAAWERAAPVVGAAGFEAAADDIRAAALHEPAPTGDLRRALAEAGVDADEVAAVRDAVRALHYGNSKYLLVLTAWAEGIQGRSSGGTDPDPAWDGSPLPRGTPADMPGLTLVDPRHASRDLLLLLDRVVDRHLHHGPASDFRVLAGWPAALDAIDREVLAPVVRTEPYDLAARALLHRARAAVHAFPQPAGLDPAEAGEVTSPRERAAVVSMLWMFQRFILDVTLDMARVTQALEGPAAARRNPFPPDLTAPAP